MKEKTPDFLIQLFFMRNRIRKEEVHQGKAVLRQG